MIFIVDIISPNIIFSGYTKKQKKVANSLIFTYIIVKHRN